VSQHLSPLDDFILRMPKAELHLHLEGAIAPATLLEIAQRNQVEIPARDVSGVEQLFDYRDFHEFLTVFMALARALLYPRDFEQIAYELGASLAPQQVRYAEVMISPAQYYRRGMDLNEVIDGTLAGFARATRDFGVRFGLALDYGRQFGVEQGRAILEQVLARSANGIVAWSIGGDELAHPPEPYAEIYADARRAGLHVMAHAGEVVGPASVWGAIDALGAERLGHGIRSIDDPRLLAELRERRVTLDVCPTSNVRTGAVASMAEHPLRRLFDAGVLVTVNTDDPVFFGTDLVGEYRIAAEAFGFGADELTQLALNAVEASFLPASERAALRNNFMAEIAALREELQI
jgi:adenosine deaminase